MARREGDSLRNREIEALIEQMLSLYKEAEQDIAKELQAQDLSDFQAFRLKDLQRQVKDTIKSLNRSIPKLSTEAIYKAYKDGVDLAAQEAQRTGVEVKGDLGSMGNALNTKAVQVLAASMAQELVDAHNSMSKTLTTAIRKSKQTIVADDVLSRAVSKGIIEGKTRKQITKDLVKILKENMGDSQFVQIVNKNGKVINFKPETYANIVTRTRTMEAVNEGVKNTAKALGMDLVQVSVHDGACAICQGFQGRIYSASGDTPGFPRLDASPPYHPHCRHVLLPVTAEYLKDRGQFNALKKLSNAKTNHAENWQSYQDFLKAN